MQQMAHQAGMHTLFRKALPSDGNHVQEWLKQVEAWEANPKVHNLYFRKVKHMSLRVSSLGEELMVMFRCVRGCC